MSKSFQMLAVYSLLFVFAQSMSSVETEKIAFNPTSIQYESNESKNDLIKIKIKINSKYHQNMVVGYNGTFIFTTEYIDSLNLFDAETLEQESSFTTFMFDENQKILNTTCRLWKPENAFLILCDANFFEEGSHSVRIGNKSFEYRNKYLFDVNFYGEKNFIFNQQNTYFPFIYSAKQNININNAQSSYELKFKFNTYYNEILYIHGTSDNYLILDNCEKIDKNLLCKISKNKIEEVLISKNEEFRLVLMSDTIGTIDCTYVYPITINYEDVQKENININLEKIVANKTRLDNTLVFETNVDKIPNLITNKTSEIPIPKTISYFKKMTGKKLMLFVKYESSGQKNIPGVQNEIILNNIHYKYNFRIQPFQFNEKVDVGSSGDRIFLVYPEKLDFIANNYTIIRFITNNQYKNNEFKLNKDSKSYLQCEDLRNMKKCVVPNSHFNGKTSGYYNIYNQNYTYYDVPLINVIKELSIEYEDNNRRFDIGYQGILNLVLNYNDSGTNIFNAYDIEEKTNFETTIVVDNTNKINVYCRLWKPIDEKLNMLCQLSRNLKHGSHGFILSSSLFNYNGQNYTIIQRRGLSLYQLDRKLSFLYAGKQVLNIDENIQTYYLTFKIGEYQNEYLMIPGEGVLNYGGIIVLDECSVQGKELKCKIEKDVIEEYTTYNGQKLNVYFEFPYRERDLIGKYNYIHSIYGVYINYPLNKKKVTVKINKLLEDNIDEDNFIAYETNVNDISNVHSKTFSLTLANGNIIECCLKKTIGISLTLICEMRREGNFSLGQIDNKIELNNINIKYNFVIQPINNDEKCIISGEGGYMKFIEPKVFI